jgi:hypothetical protein
MSTFYQRVLAFLQLQEAVGREQLLADLEAFGADMTVVRQVVEALDQGQRVAAEKGERLREVASDEGVDDLELGEVIDDEEDDEDPRAWGPTAADEECWDDRESQFGRVLGGDDEKAGR